MAEYVEDQSGGVVCADCAVGACISVAGWQCEAEHCRCDCRDLDDPDTALGAIYRARELDDRPGHVLDSIARDMEAEARPDVAELMAERYGQPRRGAA
jgi:hypothetical protein